MRIKLGLFDKHEFADVVFKRQYLFNYLIPTFSFMVFFLGWMHLCAVYLPIDYYEGIILFCKATSIKLVGNIVLFNYVLSIVNIVLNLLLAFH